MNVADDRDAIEAYAQLHRGRVFMAVRNSEDHEEGWHVYLSPRNARRFASILVRLAEKADGDHAPGARKTP